MNSSDSEDFESADEGHTGSDKKGRKPRLSSSNYSDNLADSDSEVKKSITPAVLTKHAEGGKNKDLADGWDDFEIDEDEIVITESEEPKKHLTKNDEPKKHLTKNDEPIKKERKSEDTGWDDFDDWGEDDLKSTPKNLPSTEKDLKEITDCLDSIASTTTTTSGWGWGWNVDSLINTATAGISTLTTITTQTISSAIDSTIGAVDPEELARISVKDKERLAAGDSPADTRTEEKVEQPESGDSFQFENFLSGVTKFVGDTGSKVINHSLDTLETIGKKTMEVLQDGDPGLVKKRALFGLDPGSKPVLSQVLREAKAKADEEDKVREEKQEAKEVHYENLFDDFEGLVHLEALEMLSKQVGMRIDERLRTVDVEKRQDIKETLQQVAELCEIPEEDEDDESPSEESSKPDAFLERLQNATQDLGVKIHFQPLIKQYTEVLSLLSTEESNPRSIYKNAISSLAQSTALSMEIYHKTGEMMLVKSRRSTADEADAATQLTIVLTKHVSELATLFTEKLNSIDAENKDQINNYITNIFLEAGNSSTYIQNAFQLILPILQIGAV